MKLVSESNNYGLSLQSDTTVIGGGPADIPTKVSAFENDANYVSADLTDGEESGIPATVNADTLGGYTREDIISETMEEVSGKGYVSARLSGGEEPGLPATINADTLNGFTADEIVANIQTASADTKGLVKVGDGLVMSGDVLSVAEGEFELIETITLEETTSEIVRSELVGYKEMMICVLFPAGTTGYCYAGIGETWTRRAVGTLTVGSSGSSVLYCLRTIFKQLNGIWDVYGYHGYSGNKSDAVGQVSVDGILTTKDLPLIKYVRVYGTGLVAGTKIDIWGVRA